MAVKIQKNGRDFTLSWEDFEKAFYCIEGCKVVGDIEPFKRAGNC